MRVKKRKVIASVKDYSNAWYGRRELWFASREELSVWFAELPNEDLKCTGFVFEDGQADTPEDWANNMVFPDETN